MHTRKRARYGGHVGSGNKHSAPVVWQQLVLWLGIVALAIGLAVQAPDIRDDVKGLAPTEWTGSQAPGTSESMAASCVPTTLLSASVMNCADPRVEPWANAPPSPAHTP